MKAVNRKIAQHATKAQANIAVKLARALNAAAGLNDDDAFARWVGEMESAGRGDELLRAGMYDPLVRKNGGEV